MNRIERLIATGFRRGGDPESGFTYSGPDGPPGADDLARIEALKVPPAWTDVAISRSPLATLQAVGKDAAGRWQYRYHEAFVRRGQKRKFERMLAFTKEIPRARARVARRMAAAAPLSREEVLSGMVRVLMSTYLRPGSPEYTEKNGSYGLTTLRRRHVSAAGETVVFDFPGKSGKRQHVALRDRMVARLVKHLLRVPGAPFFRYRAEDGRLVAVRATELNAYIKEVVGGPFTAKDFRTWGATLVFAAEASELLKGAAEAAAPAIPATQRARRRIITAAIRKAAEALQNTPAICRASYIDPGVIHVVESAALTGTPPLPTGTLPP